MRVLGKGTGPSPAGQSGTVKVKLTKNGSRSLGKKVMVEVTTVDPTGNTVQNGQAKVGGKKAKNKKHKR